MEADRCCKKGTLWYEHLSLKRAYSHLLYIYVVGAYQDCVKAIKSLNSDIADRLQWFGEAHSISLVKDFGPDKACSLI